MTRRMNAIPTLVAATLVLAGCGGDETTPSGATPTGTAQPPATDEAPAPAPAQDSPGSATLTVGEVTYEFDNFRCALGHDNTASDVYAFTSDARGESAEGAALQMQANVRDSAGSGRLDGEGVFYEISIQDIDNVTEPSVSLVATSEGFLGSDATVAIDGDSLTGTAAFLDNQQVGADPVAGTLSATCSSDSRM